MADERVISPSLNIDEFTFNAVDNLDLKKVGEHSSIPSDTTSIQLGSGEEIISSRKKKNIDNSVQN